MFTTGILAQNGTWLGQVHSVFTYFTPIHNNDMERGLKIPIHGRNTKLFYKTQYGAMVGGGLTSIIYTCELAGTNPFNYLMALQVYKLLYS